ncbi:DUF5658 family protein [Defluviitalea saccharophila]|uniref:DUF5658 family protein n=1 Tax=Defluviitalea saccharophila TaxID=879970 RepID=A0ABZ2Y762_9FIRM|nr:hypothetical protein [Candidatus Epulonipiscium sp.]
MKEDAQNISIYDAKKYFIFISILNIADMFLTLVATINEYGKEINPLLSNIVNDVPLFIVIKGIMPTLLLATVYLRLKKGKIEDIKNSIKYLRFCYFWYIIILSSHFIWILTVISGFSNL